MKNHDDLADRHGQQNAPEIKRFTLSAVLLPGSSAAAHFTRYVPDHDPSFVDGTLGITVYDSNQRFFGLPGEGGWVKRHADSRHWEVISMEGCLLRHAKVYVPGPSSCEIQIFYKDPTTGIEGGSSVFVVAQNWLGDGTPSAGDTVYVFYEPKSHQWYYWRDKSGTGGSGDAVLVHLTEDMGHTTPGQASASVVGYAGENPDPDDAGIIVKDTQGLFPLALDGANGIAILFDDPEGYELVECQSQAGLISFTTAGGFSGTPKKAGSATVGSHWGTQQDVFDPGTYADIYDLLNKFGNALSGATGYAVLDSETGHYNAIICDQKALLLKTTLSSTLLRDDDTASVGSLTAMTPWPFSQVPTSPTVNNPQHHAGKTGDHVVLAIDGDNYMIIDVEKQKQQVLTQIRTSGTAIQYKNRTAVSEWEGDESDWITLDEGTTCS